MKYYLGKIFTLLVTLVLISLITFAVFQVLPGDPIRVMIGVDGDAGQYETLRKQYGLDKPLPEQYLNWATGFVRGDLGLSMKYKLPVAQLLAERIPATLTLALAAMLLTVLIGIPAGIWLARRNNKPSGFILSMFSQLGLAIPSFWGGILLILLFSVTLHWLPSGGYVAWAKDPMKCLRSIILPAVSLSLGTSCTVIRYMKNTLLDQMGADYVRTARSKGISENQVIYGHVLRNALIPVITVIGMIATDILAGSMITENVFALPGLGSLIINSITSRDLPLIQSGVMYIAVIVTLINMLVDLLYAVIDPRARIR